jgi:peptidylprolyl isomerase
MASKMEFHMQKIFGQILLSIFLFIGYPFGAKAESGDLMKEKKTIVIFETTQGPIEIALWPQIAPKACENFLLLIDRKYYDGIQFHRVIKDFMIQGGDPTATGAGGASAWGNSFPDEFQKNVVFDRPGLLAMANRGPNTNGSQFFITTVPTPWLNMRHTIFGEVVKGMDILKKLENVKCGPQDRPVESQKIIKAYVKKD